jgi:hypothetical protein
VSLTEVCSHCGFHNGVHSTACPRVFAPKPTAYDRAQAELNQHLASLAQMVTSLTVRFDRSLQRIEQLELDIARLQSSPARVQDFVKLVTGESSPISISPAVSYPPLSDEGT